jgi:polysaccharide pyruvyl transferase WcaK-like protein
VNCGGEHTHVVSLESIFRCLVDSPRTECLEAADMNKRDTLVSSLGESEMRVLVENGEYWLKNKGDLAILDVSVRRIAQRWPRARVGVLTSAPGLLRVYESAAESICYQRGGDWPRSRRRRGLLGRFGPEAAGPVLHGWDAATALPGKVALRLHRAVGGDKADGETGSRSTDPRRLALSRDGGRLPNAVGDASAVIAIGGGYLADVDRFQTERTLELLEYATDRGIPTVMIGQGIGPMHDPELLRHAARVFPRIDLIALREGLRGPDLLRSLGVSADRVVVTGDDAVELGYATRRAELGADIGVCLRVAEYSPVDVEIRAAVGRVLRATAADSAAALVPLIVSEYAAEDRRSTLPLLTGADRVIPPLGRFASARSLSRRVGRCRIVVTGAYHVAVFCMSQGIPVVGLSTSRYYDDKFEGLAAMFGTGLELVRLDGDEMEDRLRQSMRRLWTQAPELRPPLLDGAVRQIGASRAAFERVAVLVDGAVTARSGVNPGPPTSAR